MGRNARRWICWSRPPWLAGLQARLSPQLLLLPLGLGAVGVGYAGQQIFGPRSSADPALLQALLDNPSATKAPGAVSTPRTALAIPAAAQPLQLSIRVHLQDSTRPQLGSDGPWRLVNQKGEVLGQGSAGEGIPLEPLKLGGQQLWLEPQSEAPLLLDGRPYAGRLALVPSPQGWMVVNHLDLEDYLASVVGAEMPSSWSFEALKAQAVAARSYALAHLARPASRHWNLGDTTRWQAYRGLNSRSDRSRRAVLDTAGLILSYKGGIVESLYAANAQISWEAHRELGASMSQEGAHKLAQRGWQFNQILAHYYPGSSLARLRGG